VYCTECGKIHSDTAKFCSSCGSRISTSEETTTPKQEDNANNRLIVLIGVAFFCLYLIFKPGPLGVSMFDLAMVGDCTDHLLVSCEVRDEKRFYVAILGGISLACFSTVLKKPNNRRRSSIIQENQEEVENESFDIECDGCGIDCTPQSWFVQETGEDFCDVCFRDEIDDTRGIRQIKGVAISTTEWKFAGSD
jgi:hypothetical protein